MTKTFSILLSIEGNCIIFTYFNILLVLFSLYFFANVYCFTKDAQRGGRSCDKLAICLWDHGERGDDVGDSHWPYAADDWKGGTDPGTGGTEPLDIMWRFMKASVGVPY